MSSLALLQESTAPCGTPPTLRSTDKATNRLRGVDKASAAAPKIEPQRRQRRLQQASQSCGFSAPQKG